MTDRKRIDELWARFVKSETLPDRDARELLDALTADPELRRELIRDLEMDGLLNSLERGEAGEFERSFWKVVDAKQSATGFIRRVESRLPPRSRPPSWNPWILAAAALFAIVVLVAVFSGESSAPPPVAKKHVETKKEEPLPPTPTPEPPAPRVEAKPVVPPDPTPVPPPVPPPPSPKEPEPAPPKPEPSEPKPPAPAPAPRETTAAEIARVEQVDGEAWIDRPAGKERLTASYPIKPGDGFLTTARVVLSFPDKTRVEIGPGSEIKEISVEKGKRFFIGAGWMRAEVVKQSQPMVLQTPHGEATVLGTTLRIVVDPDPAKGTRLEVEEGKVRLKNLAGKTVDVPSGYYAVSASGAELAAKPSIPESPALTQLLTTGSLMLRFGPAGHKVPAGCLIDSGEEFDVKRGYGWKGPRKTTKPSATQGLQGWRDAKSYAKVSDPMKNSGVAAGWADIQETWTMPVPNGVYLVAVCVGDPGWPQGPHHVAVEGVQLFEQVLTKSELVERVARVTVKDGELTIVVGGGGKDFDTTSDTILSHLIIRRASR